MGLSEDETRRFVGQLGRANKEADEVARSTDRIRSGLGNLLAGLGLAAGIGGAVRLAGQARDAFAALQDSVNAVKVVFGEAAAPVLAFSNTVAQTAGLSMAQFNQAASVLGSSLINVGFGFDEAAAKTIVLTQRAADMASIFGGEVSVAVEAILSALRGEGNPIERFGVTLTEAKVQAEAAALGFSRVAGEFDSGAKAAARLSIIMRETERTAGDFANTSDDLANAQKVAAAEFENARAALGEALLPVFQALLDAGPEILQTIEDLAPALASLATSAGNLATSTPGVLDFVDALRLLSDLPRGFGQIFDSIKIGVSVLSGGLISAQEAAQNTLERIDTQGLIDDLREGGDAATTLANRLADVGKKGKLDPRFIADLSKIAGVDLRTNVAVLVNLIREAERLGLAADDVTALRVALALLSDLGRPDGPIRSVTDRIREIPEALVEVPGSFTDLQGAADEAGRSLTDLVLGLDPVARGLTDTLTPAQQIALAMKAIQTESGAAAQILDATLRPALIDVSDALEDVNEDGRVAASEFIANARKMTAAALALAIDISNIAAFDPATALAVSKLDPEVAADLIRELAANPDQIRAAAEAILGTPDQLGEAILEVYVGALGVLQGGDPEAITNFLAFTKEITEKSVPGVTDAFEVLFDKALNASFADLDVPDITPAFVSSLEGMDAGQIAASVNVALDASHGDIEFPDLTDVVVDGIEQWSAATIAEAVERALFANVDIDLTDAGIEAGATFIDGVTIGVSSSSAVEELRGAITSTIDDAIFRDSPPKLFLDIGKESGEAFWSGFDQADLTLKTAVPDLKGQVITGAAATGTGVNVTLITNNPTQQDEVSDTARMGQIASSIAASYRSVVPNGM